MQEVEVQAVQIPGLASESQPPSRHKYALGRERTRVLEDLDTLSLIPRERLVSIFEGAGRNCDTAVINKIYKVCSPML